MLNFSMSWGPQKIEAEKKEPLLPGVEETFDLQDKRIEFLLEVPP